MPTEAGRLVAVKDLMKKLAEVEADRDGEGNFLIAGADGIITGIGGNECIVTEGLQYLKDGDAHSLLDLMGGPQAVVIF